MWNLILVCLETVLVSVQDRCMVCAEVKACFYLFRDSVSVGAR
jgi:hypothetical protein